MSSGRSARLPPTPVSAANVVRHVVDVTALSAIGHHQRTGYPSLATTTAPAMAPAGRTEMREPHGGVATRSRHGAAADADVDASGPPLTLAVAASQVLDSLSEHERLIILDVLQRDEQVRRRDATRIM